MKLGFLLAALHVQSLSRKLTRKDIRSSLHTLPKTLDASYEEALVRIQGQGEEDAALAHTVLLWILCGKRILTVQDLQNMYAMLYSEPETYLSDEDLPDEEILIGVCKGLVVTEGSSNSVQLVHYTASQILQDKFSQDLGRTKTSMASICLKYLSLPNFSTGSCKSDVELAARRGLG